MGTSYAAPYPANRAIVLDGDPACTWCGAAATEADHVRPLCLGGTHDLDNLTPSCSSCNQKRGAKARQIRKHAGSPAPHVETDDAVDWAALDLDGVMGHTDPRLATPESFGASFGADAVPWIEDLLGVTLHPWQRLAVIRLLTVNDEGDWQYLTAFLSVARQNGKSLLLVGLLAWLLERYPAASGRDALAIGMTGHLLTLVMQLHEQVRELILARPDLFGLPQRATPNTRTGADGHYFPHESRARGMQFIYLPNGASLRSFAAKRRAGHGFGFDVIVVDEAWCVPADVITEGLEPTQVARPNPMMVSVSTAGEHAGSEWMKAERVRGLRGIDAGDPDTDHLWLEWSPPPAAPRDDPATWAWANPSLGRSVNTRVLRNRFAKADSRTVERAHLNRWVPSTSAWLGPGEWEPLTDPDRPLPADGSVAVEMRPDAEAFGLCWAGVDPDGMVVIRHALVDTERDVWDTLEQYAAGWRWCLPPELLRRNPHTHATVVPVASGEIRAWTGLAHRFVTEGGLAHDGSELLAEQVTTVASVRHHETGRPTLNTAKSGGPCELARALVWAVADATRHDHQPRPHVVT